PEEYEYRRTVNSASSVTQYWRNLIAQADSTILQDKRRDDLDKYHVWRLRFLSHTHQRGQGAYDLAVNLTYKKIEATADDIFVLLTTLWKRKRDIPCRPDSRVSFHGMVILGGTCGFRRGCIMRLTYRDVSLAVVRDPND
ncbi:hypothetical protein EJ04DRAFT_451066, partial [Polyplosphaeria fusca]